MMEVRPRKEHRWLQRLVGSWTSEAECASGADGSTSPVKGTEVVRSIGELWIVGDGKVADGKDEATMLITLGFDPERERFVGTWIGSMMTHLWVYEGELDPSGRVLTLEAEGPNPMDHGKPGRFRDVIDLVNDDHRVHTSHLLGDDGKWTQFMRVDFHRVK